MKHLGFFRFRSWQDSVMATIKLLLVLSISVPVRTCAPRRGSLHLAQGKRSDTLGNVYVWNVAL